MWLDRVLDQQVCRQPDAVALADIRRRLEWRRLRHEVRTLAARIAERAAPGDRVVVMSDNRVEVLEAYLACASAGAVVVPVNRSLADAEIRYILDYTEPRLAIAEQEARHRLANLAPGLALDAIEGIADLPQDGPASAVRDVPLDAPFGILHTSATTGHPKGAVVSGRSLMTNALSWLADVRPRPGAVYLNASPLFHGSMVIALDYLAAGATVCVLDRFTPQTCLAAIERWRVEHILLVPSMIRLLLQARGLPETDLSSLDLVLHTAEPMPASLVAQAEEGLGAELLNVYGITEGGGPVITCRSGRAPQQPRLRGAVCAGVPMLGGEARILREDGADADVGEIGEICLRGDGVMQEYWRCPDATAESLRNGWLHTGDLGYREKDGRIWVVDRRTDLILRGGQNVYPAEIERVLRDHPQVVDVAVVAAPSETWGQSPWAFVQPSAPGAFDEQALLEHVVRHLSSYKRPSRIIPVEQVPRNPSGKPLRRVLRERAAQMALTPAGGR